MSAPPSPDGSPPVSAPLALFEQRQQMRAAARRRLRRRRIWGLVAFVALAIVPATLYSYAAWMLRPSSEPFNVNSVEWVRHKVPFGNWLVDNVETAYYNANAPKKGGPGIKQLPAIPGVGHVTKAQAAVLPPAVKPVFAQPLPGEGVWKPTGAPPVNGGPPMLVTTYRPEVAYPSIVAYLIWFDHTRTQIGYYPGRYEPPNTAMRGPMMVPHDQRYRLLATFNGGFTATDGNNGSTDNGRVNEPLTRGNATLIGYRDGRVDIVKWTGGPSAGPDVAWSRQSLVPIVWDGKLNPGLDENPDSPQWGYTLGGVTRVWRTGVGVDRHGNLIYAAADGQTVITIAKILQHAGAVRAMEFDINPEWHTLVTYTHGPNGLVPTMVAPQPQQSPTRYLVPDDRDFFAVYTPLPGPVGVPFQ